MIRRIKWKNHDILGNLELDFTKPDGSIYNTIVLAGENGTENKRYLKRYRLFLTLDRSNHLSISVIWLMEYHIPLRQTRIISPN